MQKAAPPLATAAAAGLPPPFARGGAQRGVSPAGASFRVWVAPSGPAAAGGQGTTQPASACFAGLVHGAWGGRSRGVGAVAALPPGFAADLALEAGTAINAAIRAGGQGTQWMRLRADSAAAGSPQPLDLLLSLTSQLLRRPPAGHGWGADPAGAAFIGTEDFERRPLGLRMALDIATTGPVTTHARHRIAVPNGHWFPLRLRFASRIEASLGQTLHWSVQAQILATAGAESAAQIDHCTRPRHCS